MLRLENAFQCAGTAEFQFAVDDDAPQKRVSDNFCGPVVTPDVGPPIPQHFTVGPDVNIQQREGNGNHQKENAGETSPAGFLTALTSCAVTAQ